MLKISLGLNLLLNCLLFIDYTTATQIKVISLSQKILPITQNNDIINNSNLQKYVELTGIIIHKNAVKNTETWIAGGSDYYVLDVGDRPITQRTAEEGVILRPSEIITEKKLAEFVGKRVKIQGIYVPSRPYIPKHSWESYPMDFQGNPLPTGGGFKVYGISLLSTY
ncbi:MAG: hypothetical protein ACRCT1_14760 [Microcoleaceae cyanobacterium]|jgi:hypothetical protein